MLARNECEATLTEARGIIAVPSKPIVLESEIGALHSTKNLPSSVWFVELDLRTYESNMWGRIIEIKKPGLRISSQETLKEQDKHAETL